MCVCLRLFYECEDFVLFVMAMCLLCVSCVISLFRSETRLLGVRDRVVKRGCDSLSVWLCVHEVQAVNG